MEEGFTFFHRAEQGLDLFAKFPISRTELIQRTPAIFGRKLHHLVENGLDAPPLFWAQGAHAAGSSSIW